MKIKFVFLCLFFLTKIIAQNNIEGQIVSSKGEILPFSNIKLRNTNTGTFSNSEGKFILKFENTHLNDTLVISQIGFNTYKNTVKNIISNNIILFKLNESVTELDEIVITNINAKKIALSAFSKLSTNHTKQDYDAFFRSYDSNNRVWTGFIETALQIENVALSFKKQDVSIYIKEIRKSEDLFKSSNTSVSPYASFKYLLLFNSKKSNYYYNGIIKQNDTEIHQISFKSKNGVFEGDLLIDKKSLGFYKINYRVTNKGKKRYRKRKNKIDGKQIKTYLTYGKWEVDATFNKIDNKFKFESIKHNVIRNTYKRNDKTNPIFLHKIIGEMYFYNATEKNSEILPLSSRKNIFSIKQPYNKTFWNNYNAVIKDSLQESIIKILNK